MEHPPLRHEVEAALRRAFGQTRQVSWVRVDGTHPFEVFDNLGRKILEAKGAVVVVSPGNLWGKAAAVFSQKLRRSPPVLEGRLFRFGVPLAPVLGISNVFLPRTSFLGEETPLSVEVEGFLGPGATAEGEVSVRTGDHFLTAMPVSLRANSQGVVRETLAVPLRFSSPGPQVVQAELVSPLARAPYRQGATSAFVVHGKTTLLHVAVGPDWSLRSFRQKLKAWPNLDLLSYYILRDIRSEINVPTSQLALIEFPAEKLFTEQLPNFHGIVLQNFLLGNFLDVRHVENIVHYATSGGRLFQLAGPLTFEGRDPRWNQLFPCENIPQWETGTTYALGPGAGPVGQAEELTSAISHLRTSALYTGCVPRPQALVLAATTQGNHPVLLAERLGKGMVLTMLSGDWHTHFAQVALEGQKDEAGRSLEASAAGDLFAWVTEFLQRRQDSGLRPPEPAGPRLYANDTLLAVRTRGLLRLGTPVEVSIGGNTRTGATENLPFLDIPVVRFSGPAGELEAPELRDVAVRFPGDGADGVVRKGPWRVSPGRTLDAEQAENPRVLGWLPVLGAVAPGGTREASVVRPAPVTLVPLLEAYPFLVALLLLLLGAERALSHWLRWRVLP